MPIEAVVIPTDTRVSYWAEAPEVSQGIISLRLIGWPLENSRREFHVLLERHSPAFAFKLSLCGRFHGLDDFSEQGFGQFFGLEILGPQSGFSVVLLPFGEVELYALTYAQSVALDAGRTMPPEGGSGSVFVAALLLAVQALLVRGAVHAT